MRNIRLVIAYQGTHYLGWQKTKEGPSIEAALSGALERLLRHRVHLQAASRTDVGVHAAGQVVNFFTDQTVWEAQRLRKALNGLLPHDISVYEVSEAAAMFHPTLDVLGKEYHYDVCHGRVQLPHVRQLSWHCPYALQLEAMEEAMQLLIGTHDYSAFCNQRSQLHYSNYVREVRRFDLVRLDDDRLRFAVEGSNFLYKMVRNLVGTVLDLGRGKMSLQQLPGILAARDRRLAGVTAPAHGLMLHRVFY